MGVAAIVLAAGKSERMGTLKPLLPVGTSNFLGTIMENLRRAGTEEIIVVLGYEAERIKPHLPPEAKWVVNQHYKRGQLSSLKAGLKLLPPDVGAFLMVLVDHPLVSVATYKAIINLLTRGAPIVLPKYRGKRGHPVGFSSKYIKELLDAPEDIGARFVIKKNQQSIVELPVEDEYVICNINTREDYEGYINKDIKGQG